MTDAVVTHDDWAKWKWRIVLAFVILALANAYGFWKIDRERSERINTAATVALTRCQETREDRLAIRALLLVALDAPLSRGRTGLLNLQAKSLALPPIQNC